MNSENELKLAIKTVKISVQNCVCVCVSVYSKPASQWVSNPFFLKNS